VPRASQFGTGGRGIAAIAIEERQRNRNAGDDRRPAGDTKLTHAELSSDIGNGEALLHRHRSGCRFTLGLSDAHRRRLYRIDRSNDRPRIEPVKQGFRNPGIKGGCTGKRRKPGQGAGLERAGVFQFGLQRVEFGFGLNLA